MKVHWTSYLTVQGHNMPPPPPDPLIYAYVIFACGNILSLMLYRTLITLKEAIRKEVAAINSEMLEQV